jgi:multidrug efflux system membrane fusion protein
MPDHLQASVAKITNRSSRSILLFCAALSIGCSKVESYEKPPTPVRIRTVEQQVISAPSGTQGTPHYSANLQPNSQIGLAFKNSGYVDRIFETNGRAVEAGDWVEKGTVLARLRDDEFGARARQIQASMNEARGAEEQVRAQLAEAQTAQNQLKHEFDRATRLFEADALTRPEFEASRSKFDAGQARLEAVRAQISMARARIDTFKAQLDGIEIARAESELKAPMSGIVLKRNIEIGSLAAPGAAAFLVADLSTVRAIFGVPDVTAAQFKPRSPMAVTTEAIRGVEFHGRIDRIAPSADPKTRVFDIEVVIPNPRLQLKVGMVVSLHADASPGEPRSVTLAPLAALLQLKEKDAGYAVFLVEERGGRQIARQRRVMLGETVGNQIIVTNGVNPGDRLIVSGAALLNDGDIVHVVQ